MFGLETEGNENTASSCCSGSCSCEPENGTIKYEDRKIGRNEPCPCGSNRKFKKCCGKKV